MALEELKACAMRMMLQRQSQAPNAEAMSAARPGIAARPLAPPLVHDVLRSCGQPLDHQTRAFFDSRYDQDFSRVRVHADARAAASADAVGASAYTVGSSIAFADGRYRPHTPEGKRLLAHELAHVAQQRGAAGPDIEIGRPSDAAEHEADTAAKQALKDEGPVALGGGDASPTLRRTTVETWGGTFDNDAQYKKHVEHGKGEGNYGVDAVIRFTPKPAVKADKVALVQTANSQIDSETKIVGDTAAKFKDQQERSTASGTHIDQPDTASRTPLAAMQGPPKGHDDLASSKPTDLATFGVPAATSKIDTQALLEDIPRLGPIPDDKSASQTLETAALAVSGPQAGVYYGSVRWGWRKDAGAKDVELVTLTGAAHGSTTDSLQGNAPTAEFGDASRKWNASKTDSGEARIALPVAASKYVTHAEAPLMERAAGGRKLAVLKFKSEVQVTDKSDPKHPDWSSVIVTAGAAIGKEGFVQTSLLGDILGKKPSTL